jgi:hypothetical protein
MTDNAAPAAPDIGDAHRGWLAARKETDAHLTDNEGPPLTKAWIQKLSDLLATEHAWQEQYKDLLGFGGVGTFPESRR